MPDMLVHLLKLPRLDAELDRLRGAGVIIRRGRPYEISRICKFVSEKVAPTWADEISVGFANKPSTVFIAIRDQQLVGFAAYECTTRGFFGPMGVLESERGKHVGRALLIACLHGMRDMGYAYGIIGGVGPAEFYTKAVGATLIPDSSPGVYADPIAK
jgi:predicted N-acetyltransferase YhbS